MASQAPLQWHNADSEGKHDEAPPLKLSEEKQLENQNESGSSTDDLSHTTTQRKSKLVRKAVYLLCA